MVPQIPVYKDYHHLESNRALPRGHPLLKQSGSEAQDSFTLPIKTTEEYSKRKREGLEDRAARIRESKSTHYVVGYDPAQMESEQVGAPHSRLT